MILVLSCNSAVITNGFRPGKHGQCWIKMSFVAACFDEGLTKQEICYWPAKLGFFLK